MGEVGSRVGAESKFGVCNGFLLHGHDDTVHPLLELIEPKLSPPQKAEIVKIEMLKFEKERMRDDEDRERDRIERRRQIRE